MSSMSDGSLRQVVQNYANIAAVLAGFAFAGVILIAQMLLMPELSPRVQFLAYTATIAFLVSFVGCLITAFMLGAMVDDDGNPAIVHDIAFFGGLNLSLSAIFMFWGLAAMIKGFVTFNLVINIASLLFLLIIIISPLIVTFSYPIRRFVPAYIIILVFVVARLLFEPIDATKSVIHYVNAIVALLAIVVSTILGFGIMRSGRSHQLAVIKDIFLIAVHSVIVGLLYLSI